MCGCSVHVQRVKVVKYGVLAQHVGTTTQDDSVWSYSLSTTLELHGENSSFDPHQWQWLCDVLLVMEFHGDYTNLLFRGKTHDHVLLVGFDDDDARALFPSWKLRF